MNDVAAGNDTVRSVRQSGWFVLALGIVVALAACGGEDKDQDRTPTADASATAAAATMSAAPPTPASTPVPEFGEVVWTTAVDSQSKQPIEPVDAFSTDTATIYAALLVRNLPPNTILTADWTYNDTSLDGLTTSAVAASGIEDGWVEFHLTRSDEPWPDGTYAISVRFAGTVVQSGEVEVEDR